jgi:predicted nucleotidyltransferase component of viral defense system
VRPTDVDHFYREVARVALTVADRYGFVLGGGVAWVLSGLVQRPTEDIDLFSDTDGAAAAAADGVRAALLAAGFHVQDEEVDTQLGDLFYGFDLDQKEFLISNGERTVRLSLCRLDRHTSPVVMDVGPVMSIEDLVATKAAALVNRREVRDYIDVAAALERYSVDELLDLAHRQDPGLEPTDILEAGHFLDRLDDNRFTYYGLSADQIASLRRQLATWPR